MIHKRTILSSYPSAEIVITTLGSILFLTAIFTSLIYSDPLIHWLSQLFVSIGIPTILIIIGFKIGHLEFTASEQVEVLKWTVSGVCVSGLLSSFIIIHQTVEGTILSEPGYIVLVCGSVGAVAGTTAGVTENQGESPRLESWMNPTTHDANRER